MKNIRILMYIGLILLPMFFFLNPFIWGMRRKPCYEPNRNTEKLLDSLQKEFNVSIYISSESDTLWYFRDILNKKQDTLDNMKLIITNDSNLEVNPSLSLKLATKFKDHFVHRSKFDSLIVEKDNKIIQKIKF